MRDGSFFKTKEPNSIPHVDIKDVWARFHLSNLWKFSWKDTIVTILVFLLLTVAAFFFNRHASDPTLNIAMLYTLGVFIVARYTEGYAYGILFSIASVLSVNFYFTYPFKDFNFTLAGYQITFIGMLIIGIATSITSTIMKEQSNAIIEQEQKMAEQEKIVSQAEKEKMRANLLRAVSHDLRTPLTGIIGNSETYANMVESLSEEEKTKIVKSIGNDANWLLNMVENLLTVTRINEDGAKVVTEAEAVDEVIASTVTAFKKRFPTAEIVVSTPDEFAMCQMDSMLIQQVLLNLLQNAVMHAKSVKPVELFATVDDKNVYFHVKDYGIGISEDKIDKIFDGEGLRTDSADADGYKGMGIGLSICKTIILAHGGEISCSNHESGAEFVFSLPKEEE